MATQEMLPVDEGATPTEETLGPAHHLMAFDDQSMNAVTESNLAHNNNGVFAHQAVVRSISPGNLSQDSIASSMDAEERGALDVRVVPARTLRRNVSNQFSTDMSCYKMTSVPRGLALIVEIEKYENDIHDRRIGSNHDVENLKKLFVQLDFRVQVEINPHFQQFIHLLNNFSKDNDHLYSDMMILVILSHGKEGHVITSDGRVYPTEAIFEKFNNQNCPNLIGKPKFFIIQACRGQDTDSGWEEQQRIVAKGDEMNPGRAPNRGMGNDSIPINFDESINKARPTWEDMIIAYSTIPGYASIRDHDTGTWFIQSLVEVFMNFSCDRELIDLLRMTSEYLSRFTNMDREKQTCNIEMRHLYKRIYFNPGLPVAASAAPPSPRPMTRSRSTPPASPRRNIEK